MDFRELSYVQAIAKYQSITKASEALYIGQPTLSKFLKALETDLGIPLFRRLGHKYVLTYAGECYVAKAEQILQLKRDLDLEMADIIKKDIGVVKIGFPTMRCTYMLPCILPPFHNLYPNVKVQIKEGYSDELDNQILEGDVDIAFYTQPANTCNPQLNYEILGEEELLICTCKNHPIGQFATENPASPYPRLDPSLLKHELVISMFPPQRTRQVADDYLRQKGIVLENMISTSNMPAIMELVSAGYGVAFIFEPHLQHRIVSNPIECYSFGEPRTVSNFVAVYRKGAYLPKYAKDLIELTRQLYRKKN